jgi:hypothetical protein
LQIELWTNNSQQVTLTSGGNLLVGTTTDSGFKLNVNGTGFFGSPLTATGLIVNSNPFTLNSYLKSSSTTGFIVNDSTDSYNNFIVYNSGNGYLRGNLGIGTSSPGAKLEISQSTDNTDGPTLRISNNANTLSNGQLIGAIDFYNGDDSGTGNAVGSYIRSYMSDGVLPTSSQYLSFATGGTTERMRLDSAGNLGLGVTPSASNLPTFESQYGLFVGQSQTNIVANGYYSSGYIYKNTDLASRYQQISGQHVWYTAPSGTAGNAISFTQAMTLDASGRLGIGTTSPSVKLVVSNGGNLGLEIDPTNTSGTVVNMFAYDRVASVYRPLALNSGGGNVLIGTTTDTGYKLDVNGTGRFSGALTVVSSGTKSTIAIGNTASSTYSQLLMYGGSGKYNWSLGAQYNVNNGFEITPSTATDGTTFTTPVFQITNSGAATFSSSVTVSGTRLSLGNQEDIVSTTGITLGGNASTIEMVASNFSAGYGAKIEQADPGDGFTYTRIFGRANTTSWTQNLSINNTTGAATFSSSVTAGGDLTLNGGSTFAYQPTIRLYSAGGSTSTDIRNYAILSNYTSFGDFGIVQSNAKDGNPVTAGTTRLYINLAGNVGIGTSSPARPLDVNGTMRIADGSSIEWGGVSAAISGTSASNALLFYTSSSERMRITSGGQILMGTTSAQSGARLQVAGGFLDVWSSANTLLRLNHDGTRGVIETFTGGAYSPTSINPNGGNVLIGTTTDSGYKLNVNGNIQAAGFFESSDKRLKDILFNKDSENFGAISFNWKDKRDSKLHWGYVAQEVEKFLPDAIIKGNDGFLSIDYNQAHTFKIAMIEDEVTILKKRVKELETQLNLG